ncbi:hypothetical protein [Mesorhizobium sp. M1406]|uniref:hypothetical protein n=1 Tax=Mesorhizobium sp. M1406 TaxID=2957099 RepID=UPI003339728D
MRKALARCVRVDECRHWSAKAQALASYARQMNDESLFRAARRIQDRAMIRSGELLAEIEAENGKRTDLEPISTKETGSPRQQAAKEAGFSPKQAADAIAAARVLADEADALIESDDLPTASRPPRVGTHVPKTGGRFARRPGGGSEASREPFCLFLVYDDQFS